MSFKDFMIEANDQQKVRVPGYGTLTRSLLQKQLLKDIEEIYKRIKVTKDFTSLYQFLYKNGTFEKMLETEVKLAKEDNK